MTPGSGRSVSPGRVSDTSKQQLSSSGAVSIRTKNQPYTIEFEIWDKTKIEVLMEDEEFRNQNWIKDYIHEKPVDVIMVRGNKVVENKSPGITLDTKVTTVDCVCYLYSAYFLILIKENFTATLSNVLHKYLKEVKDGSIGFVPKFFKTNFEVGYIYETLNNAGRKIHTIQYGVMEFCRLLKESQVSSVPFSVIHQQGIPVPDIHPFSPDDRKTLTFKEGNKSGKNFATKYYQNSGNYIPNVHCKGNMESEISGDKENLCQRSTEPDKIDLKSEEKIHTSSDGREQTSVKTDIVNTTQTCPKECNENKAISHLVTNEENSVKPKQTSNSLSQGNPVGFNNLCETERCDKSSDSRDIADGKGIGYSNRNGPQVTPNISENNKAGSNFKVTSESISSSQVSVKKNVNDEQYEGKCKRDNDDLVKQEVLADYSSKSQDTKNSSDDKMSTPVNENYAEVTKKDCKMKGNGNEKSNQSNPQKGIQERLCSNKGSYSKSHKDHSTENKVSKAKIETNTSMNLKRENENVKPENDSKFDDQKKRKNYSLSHNLGSQKKLNSGLGNVDDDDDQMFLKMGKKQFNKEPKEKLKKRNCKQMKSKLLQPVLQRADPCGFQRKYFGVVNEKCPEKVILLLGASGSGKTMLINFIANYFMEKKTADEELIHVEPTVPTTEITAYTFCRTLDDVPITIFDTPGLNDASGAEVRDHVQTLKTFLANVSANGYDIHAIGFVAQAHLVRLTSSERLVMSYVSTVFDHSVSDHLITFVTFADNQDSPPVVEAMKNFGVSCRLSLKFNNSALNNSKEENIDDLDRVYWKVCRRNWKKCLKTLSDLSPLSVNAMKAVQNEIYASTVIKSVERDLNAELASFFAYESILSEDTQKACNQIWNLAAIIYHHRLAHDGACGSLDQIVTDFALSACKVQNKNPDDYIHFLSLNRSRPLVVSGIEIIRIMAPLYKEAQRWHGNSDTVFKNITEWSYCYKCKREHSMERDEASWAAKLFKGQSTDIIYLKCTTCRCDGGLHGPSEYKSPFNQNRILQKTLKSLRKTIVEYSLPSFPVPDKIFLKFLNALLNHEHKEFLSLIYQMMK